MKYLKLTSLLILLSYFIPQTTTAQSYCSFDKKLKELIEANPENEENFRQTETQIKQYIANHAPGSTIAARPTIAYNIPVVVHVMHTGGIVGSIYNPSDANIIGTINYLNQVFAGAYSGLEAPVEGGPIVNMEITFSLAQRTSSCGYTNGIDRVDASSIPNYTTNGVGTGGCTDLDLKNFARWDPSQYYNIWVVNKINGADGTVGQFVAGYAYFAGASASLDGTVMLATQMQAGQKVLPHEIGHAFNLYHTFEGSSLNTQCPTNTTCGTDGDAVCDTDPITNNVNGSGVYDFSCRTGTNSCTGTAYTKNTEKNFMSYTTCSTLFTNGQKARVQAAMSLPSRASLGSSLGATACGSVVNFGTPASTITEDNLGTTTGCRMYKDYTYQMSIGAAPTQNATVTLTYSGTATKGLDYDVTTNGNFTTPSNSIVFNSGSTTSMPFTVRIYNDANVESNETAILNFTLNNGGGNAATGATIPTFTVTIADNDAAPVATSSSTFTIGSLASGVSSSPFNSANTSQRTQTLYTAAELITAGLTAGNINAVQLFVNSKNTTGAFTNFTVKMAQVANTVNFLFDNSNGTNNFVNTATTVFTTPSFSTTTGWNNFNLSTAFAWDGVSNLVIEYCYSGVSGTGADQIGAYTGTGLTATQSTFCYQSGIGCGASFTSFNLFGSGVRPEIKLGLSVTGTIVETALNATKSEHIDVGSNDYIYSAGNGLMARISGVNAALGCVSTTIENAGTTWTSFSGGQRSTKVITVTPTTNITTTNYTISLYYTSVELGGNAPAGLKIAKTSAATMAGANGTNTILATPTITSLGTNSVYTANFTGFSKFFLVNNAVVVPVKLLNFSGIIKNRITTLSWSTSQEINNAGFDVEKSNDGINFTKILYIAGLNNTSTVTNYIAHDNNTTTVQYYRLKQIDIDGNFEYSNIIKLINTEEKQDIVSITNPFNSFIDILFAKDVNKYIDIALLDTKGSLLYSKKLYVNFNKLNIQNIPNLKSGLYILKIDLDGQIFSKKIIR